MSSNVDFVANEQEFKRRLNNSEFFFHLQPVHLFTPFG